ncbi:tyrosine-type recombinase/integrase [Granulosicoccaceae sp. 1_MG-2023]|nr:tyrosine-type recombinase/integrase [Granulosicoccaceae sp. 1_MG-2023]
MTNRLKFTKRSIEAIEPADKLVTYHDTERKSLKLSVSPKPHGTKTFFVYRKIRGRPERIKIGRFPDITIELARQQASVIDAEIAKGHNRNDVKRALRDEPTLGELFDRYKSDQQRKGKKSLANEVSIYRNHLRTLGSRKLSHVTTEALKALHAKISIDHPTQANRVLSLARTLFNAAIHDYGLFNGDNPCAGIRKNHEQPRDRFLMSDELSRFFAAVAEEQNPVIRDYILMSLLTGARRSNVLAMRWDQIHFDRGEWHIPDTKNGEPHIVPLVEDALQLLRVIRETNKSKFVFPGHGKSGHLAEPKKGWARIKEAAGIKNLRLHDLRRSLASWSAMSGASLIVVGKALGHKSQSATSIYARLQTDPVRDAMEKAVTAMRNADKPKASVSRLQGARDRAIPDD